jgi:TPR repeat protein
MDSNMMMVESSPPPSPSSYSYTYDDDSSDVSLLDDDDADYDSAWKSALNDILTKYFQESAHDDDDPKKNIPKGCAKDIMSLIETQPHRRCASMLLFSCFLDYDDVFTEAFDEATRKVAAEKENPSLHCEIPWQSFVNACLEKDGKSCAYQWCYQYNIDYRQNCEEESYAVAQSMYFHAKALISGVGVPAKDLVRAKDLMQRAAEHGHPFALMEFGEWYRHGFRKMDIKRDKKKAMEYFKKGVENGNGFDELAHIYALGKMGQKKDPKAAFDLWERWMTSITPDRYIFSRGERISFVKFRLGYCYVSGFGVTQDVPKGIKLLEESGCIHPQAYFLLANIFGMGRYVAKDKQRAKVYVSQALSTKYMKDKKRPILNRFVGWCARVLPLKWYEKNFALWSGI